MRGETYEPDPREVKLPVWVQREMERLRLAIQQARSERDAAIGAVNNATVFVDRYTSPLIPVAHDRIPIRFRLGNTPYGDIEVVVGNYGPHQERAVQVRASGGPVMVMPQASNVIVAWVGQR